MGNFIDEFKRRKVLRALAIYVVSAWVLIQVLGEAFDAFDVPEAVLRYVWIAAVLVFPLAMVFAWRFDFADGRIVATPAVAAGRDGEAALQTIDYVLLVALALVLLAVALGVGRQAVQTQPAPSRHANSHAKSIAVLRFENMSGQIANESFTAGIHDDILTQIAKIGDLKVISRTSVERLDPDLSLPEIGALLDVATVLEGGVQRVGDQLRINVQLIDANSDTHLWAETFDLELNTRNIFELQSEIARKVAASLQATLSPQEIVSLDKVPTGSLEAYESYLFGNHSMSLRTIPSLSAARGHFERALQLDPDYALANAGLANTLLLMSSYGTLPLSEALAQTDALLARALELDPQLAAAYAAKGHGLRIQGRFAEATDEFERAIELDANYAPAWHWYGDALLADSGPIAEALPLLERARALDPLSPVIHVTLGEVFEGLGQFDKAMTAYRKALTIEPDYPTAYFLMAHLSRFAFGRADEAVRWHHAEIATDPTRSSAPLGSALLDLEDTRSARHWIDRAMAQYPQAFFSHAAVGQLHLKLGEEEAALYVAGVMEELFPQNNNSLYMRVNYGRYDEALAPFSGQFTKAPCSTPAINRGNIFHAINISLALEKTGAPECAQRLLVKVQNVLRSLPRLGSRGYGIADVEVYARQGRKELALATLREAIEAGWRGNWWAQGATSPHNESIADDPRFIGMMDEIRADMAGQLENVRRWEASGEIEEIPSE